ncbi:MFS transporter [Brachybacterium halotolerans subsp. kimchii]|uniref:MFS transporter n=1 Tax=Brachybacterium halotolerans TaxID=2795215 RepID=UPI001E512CB6|nr:MFS transporter [Brachybacterium halotolerans]UEJ83267.1 MFS transporter [Brachybacterium halotolerans subsp. kimchii]
MTGEPRPPAPDIPIHDRTGPSRLLLPTLCTPMFLVLLDVMAMNVAMPSLGRALGVGPASWPQVVDAYTVPLALALVPAGLLVDRLGPRRSLLAGLLVCLLACVLGGIAGSWGTVLLARLVQGISAAVMLPAGLAALTLTWTEPAPRAHALGLWSAVSAIATAIGPGVGGLLVGAVGWRAVFWVNVPLLLLALVGTARLLPGFRSGAGSGSWDVGGEADAPASASGAPPALRPLLVSILVAAMMTSGANGTLQAITVHLQHSLRLAAAPAGAVLLLATAPFVVLGPLSGRLVAARGRRATAAAGLVLGGCGLLTLGHLGTGADVVSLVPALLGIGVGLGLMTSAIVGETMAAWPSRPGLAGGLNNALRQAGTSLGVAVGGAIAAHSAGAGMLARVGGAAGTWWLLGAVLVLCAFTRGSRTR